MNIQAVPHVFVVDDERTIADTTALIFQQRGYKAVAFTSPLEALRSLTAGSPHLMIIDVRMPEMSGVTLAIRAKQIDPSLKILLTSGMAEHEDLLADARMQGFEFPILCKPIHPTDLIKTIQAMLERPTAVT